MPVHRLDPIAGRHEFRNDRLPRQVTGHTEQLALRFSVEPTSLQRLAGSADIVDIGWRSAPPLPR
jgi:hypothetical protein